MAHIYLNNSKQLHCIVTPDNKRTKLLSKTHGAVHVHKFEIAYYLSDMV